MTSVQAALLEFLQQDDSTPAAKAKFKRSFKEFVLKYGWWYQPVEAPSGIVTGTEQQCFKNAAELARPDGSLIYCEGYALYGHGLLRTLHAWVTDGRGNGIDNTWSNTGIGYVGVPFRWNFVAITAVKNHATVSLLDDWKNGWPLCCELGDRPDEWLEVRGRGTERVRTPD